MRGLKKAIHFIKLAYKLVAEVELLVIKIISLVGWLFLLIEMIMG